MELRPSYSSNGRGTCAYSPLVARQAIESSASMNMSNRDAGGDHRNRIHHAIGLGHGVKLHADGSLECFGANDDGQCSPPPDLKPVRQVGVGRYHTCALLEDGSIRCWGNNAAKQCTPPSGLDSAQQIAVGQWHNLALLKTGEVVAWGKSSSGECSIPAETGQIRKIVAGDGFSAALRADGTVITWGNVKDRGLRSQLLTRPVADLHAGTDHLLALHTDGSVTCWGSNQHAQVWVPLEARQQVVAIHASLRSSFAKTASGQTVAWGTGAMSLPWEVSSHDLRGVLRNYKVALAPTLVHSLELGLNARDPEVVKSAHGTAHFISLLKDGSVRCGGSDTLGQCQVPTNLQAVLEVAAGENWSAVRTASGAVFIWGRGCSTLPWPVSGEAALDLLDRSADVLEPPALRTAILGLSEVGCAESARTHTAVLFRDGRVRCWGDDSRGQCRIPEQVHGVVEIRASEDFTAARGSDGSKWIWGGTCHDMPWPETRLHAGSTFLIRGNRMTVQADGRLAASDGCAAKETAGIRKVRNACSITSSTEHSLALIEGGSVVCWGLNGKRKSKLPTDLGKCDQVAVGDEWSAAHQKDGLSRVWGFGCPGLPWEVSDADARSLVQRDCTALSAQFACALLTRMPELIHSRDRAPSARHEAVLLTTGQVLCLGDNVFGQCIVPTMPPAKKISCGDFHTLALCIDGTVAAWGWSSSGQLDVPPSLRATDIEAIGFSSWAISVEGTLHCWGRTKDADALTLRVSDHAWLKFAMTHLGKVKLKLFPEHIRKSREFRAIRDMRKLAGD